MPWTSSMASLGASTPGGGGNISVVDATGNTLTIAVVAGACLPIGVKRVRATGTTATGIIALY
jgi:hypothetical protein